MSSSYSYLDKDGQLYLQANNFDRLKQTIEADGYEVKVISSEKGCLLGFRVYMNKVRAHYSRTISIDKLRRLVFKREGNKVVYKYANA